jgi:hypothetical protein
VEIEGASCLEFCKEQMGKEGRGKSPFIKINDEVISEASVQSALEKINNQICFATEKALSFLRYRGF